MKNRIFAFTRIVYLLLLLNQAYSQTPPPPLGPPLATDEANGGLLTTFLRAALQEAGEEIIDTANSQLKVHPSSRAKLSWASNAKPLECDYDCFSAPFLEPTKYIDRPNHMRVVHRGRLSFRISDIKQKIGGKWVSAVGVERTVHTNVDFYAYCEGWQGGKGKIRIYTKTHRPFLDESHKLAETITNFILLPANISRFVDAQISKQLNAKSGLPAIEAPNGDCGSLGVISNAPLDDRSRFDNIIWDRLPAKKPFENNKVALPGEKAEVRFISIKRRKTINSQQAQQDDVRFTFYVNGQAAQYPPNAAKIKIAENQTVNLGRDVVLKVPLSKNDPVLQVLVSNNLQAAGWKQYARKNKYGHGSKTLQTSRAIPAPPLKGAGSVKGSKGKPTKVTVNEFEISYAISYQGQPVVKGTAKSKLLIKKQMFTPPANVQ